MPRIISSDLQALLDLDGCETQTTLYLALADGVTEYFFSAYDFTIVKGEFTGDLQSAGDINQSISSATDRVSVSIQNVDKVFGGVVMAEDLVKAVAVIGRIHYDVRGILPSVFTELFRGEALPQPITEGVVQLEIVSDLIASGYCIANWTLADPCQFVFKRPGTCGYSGIETLCNKKRFSRGGCKGRDNMHRFGGMEYPPENRLAPPTSGSGGGGTNPTCFVGETMVDITFGQSIDFATLYAERERYIGGPILSFDDDGNIAGDTLTEVMRHANIDEMLEVYFADDDEPTIVKPEHLFLTESNGFMPIGELTAGMSVYRRLGQRLMPDEIADIVRAERTPEFVYNLTTAVHHHYFANGSGVHNSKPPLPD